MPVQTEIMKLSQLFKSAGLPFSLEKDPPIQGLSYDSRAVQKGDLFFAIKGENFDGHKFIAEVEKKGAAAAIVTHVIPAGLPQVPTDRIFPWLSRLSAAFHGHPSGKCPVIGITGTNGKTTVTYILEKMFQHAGTPCGVMGTVDYRFGDSSMPAPNTTPMALDIHRFLDSLIQRKASALVMEVSSHALDLHRVDDVQFAVGVFTNLTQDHLDFHQTMEAYFNAKAKLFRGKKEIRSVINADDSFGQRLAAELKEPLLFGFNEAAKVRAVDFDCDLEGVRFHLKLPSGKTYPITTNLLGRHNISNLLAAAGAALAFGMSEKEVVEGLNLEHYVPGRLEKVPTNRGFIVVVDYAHTPDALLQTLKALKEIKPGKIICVFGAGGDRDRKKRPLMGKIAAEGADQVVLTSDNPRTEDPQGILDEIEAGIKSIGRKNYVVIENRAEAIRKGIRMAEKGDVVLIAGKGHENYQIYGKEKKHFSDQETAVKVLKSWT